LIYAQSLGIVNHYSDNMRTFSHRFFAALLANCISFSYFLSEARSQITPDNTLGQNNSTATYNGNNISIGGGLLQGTSHFHSFQDFSITETQNAVFNSPSSIGNILVRVTGSNLSNILGTLTSLGNQNIFFLNPNGILFGPNARLNINGSFFATTAKGFLFSDGSIFSSDGTSIFYDPKDFSLVFENPGPIIISNVGHNTTESIFSAPLSPNTNPGFGLENGQSLGIIGGDVIFLGGIISSNSSNINIGSVSSGFVSFSNDLFPEYTNVTSFGSVNLFSNSLISTTETGSINIVAKQINLSDSSGILHFSSSTQQPGSINITAFDALNLINASPGGKFRSTISSQSINDSKSADIRIRAGNLNVLGGSVIGSKSFQDSFGGAIDIKVDNTINVIGFDPSLAFSNQFSAIASITLGNGDSGALNINSDRINLFLGGDIGSATFSFGDSGNVNVNAEDITIAGFALGSFAPSTINAASFGFGDAGTVSITTGNLFVGFGGRVGTSSLGFGDAGDVFINASDSIILSGASDDRIRTSIESAVLIDPILQSLFPLPTIPNGNAGNVTINAPNLSLNNGATILIKNDGTGNAGTLRIGANQITLSNSSILASTSGGNGGNTEISTNSLVLRNSQINSTAAGNGNGGNTTISAQAIAGDYTSFISSNADQGTGGDIAIDTDTLIFPQENITASSNRGVDFSGNIEINAANFGPQQRKEIQPERFTEPATTTCNPASDKVSFVLTGDDIPSSIDDLAETDSPIKKAPYFIDNSTGEKVPLIEMQGWVDQGNGTAIPVAFNEGAFGGSYRSQACKNLATASPNESQ
jgi:filamentous hemagglutinin family protein